MNSEMPRFTYGCTRSQRSCIDVGNSLNGKRNMAYRLTGKVEDSDREYDFRKLDFRNLLWAPFLGNLMTIPELIDRWLSKRFLTNGRLPCGALAQILYGRTGFIIPKWCGAHHSVHTLPQPFITTSKVHFDLRYKFDAGNKFWLFVLK